MNENWFKVENLEKEYSEKCKTSEGDYYSYKTLADSEDIKSSEISSHNAIGDYATFLARIYNHLIKKKFFKGYKIADLGGGVGSLAYSMSLLGYEVHSFDISEDAHRYGKKHFPNVVFHTVAIKENTVLDNSFFDIIIAHEFYPYTRTSDYLYQKKYLEMCLNNLVHSGVLLIGLACGKTYKNLYKNIRHIKKDFYQYKINVYQIPYKKIFELTHNMLFSLILTKILSLFCISSKIICIVKK